jgi:hypothetical protein
MSIVNGNGKGTFDKPFGKPPPGFSLPDLEITEDLFVIDPPRGVDVFAERAIEAHLVRGDSSDVPLHPCADDQDDHGDYGSYDLATLQKKHESAKRVSEKLAEALAKVKPASKSTEK